MTRALIVGALLLALTPAGAFAQSAGDDQYSDPLAPSEQPAEQGQPTPAPQTTAPAPAQSEPAISTPAKDSTDAPTTGALPRTGLSLTLLLGTALSLLMGGAVLRRSVRP